MQDLRLSSQFPDINVFDPDLSEEFLSRNVLAVLTRRELEILARLSIGVRSKNIAHELNIGDRTVDFYRHCLMKKLKLSSIAEEAVLGWRIRTALAPYLQPRPSRRGTKSCESSIDNVNNPMG